MANKTRLADRSTAPSGFYEVQEQIRMLNEPALFGRMGLAGPAASAGVPFRGTDSSPPAQRFQRDGRAMPVFGDDGCSVGGGRTSQGSFDHWPFD